MRMVDYTLIVLAGGFATRLYPITKKIPKSLIRINDIPFIIHQLKLFESQGIKNIHFCIGFLGELIEKTVRESIFYNKFKITFSFDGDELLGTGGCIKNAFDFSTDNFLITYGDSYLDINYFEIVDFFKKKNKKTHGLMTVYRNEKKFDTSNVVFKDGKVSIYSKKNLIEKMNYIDYGLGVLSKKHFIKFKNLKSFDLSEVYENLAKNSLLLGFESKTRFFEIGSLEGIKDLTNHFNKLN